ncbi:MAG: Gfo/Idh/MocA family oxidoreductase [Candidatus Cloacimonetes bacterium]|nr:Gfo/Idh/MocA family oxidoreductase [Candidatus Cloacimonadota bacterium]
MKLSNILQMPSNKIKKIKIAFVGNGYMARQHLKILKKFSDVNIIGYLGSGKKPYDKVEGFGIKFDTLQQLINSGPDLVCLCTPPCARFEYERELIKENVNYFVEKPPVINKQGDLIKILVRKRNKLNIIVGFQWRYFSFNNLLKENIKNDQVRFIYAERLLSTPFNEWKMSKEKSGGIMHEFLIHVIDYCRYLFDAQAEFIGYFANKPIAGKRNDNNYDLNDSEVLVFKVKNILCNIFGTNYSFNNNFFKLTLVGQKNIYRISFEKNGDTRFEIINNNKIKKTLIEKYDAPYIKESIFLINQIKSASKKNDKYIDSLLMSERIIKAIKKGKLF